MFKKYMANIYICNMIINKFCDQLELYLIILLKVNKNSKINFYYNFLFFSLVIYLKIKDGKNKLGLIS